MILQVYPWALNDCWTELDKTMKNVPKSGTASFFVVLEKKSGYWVWVGFFELYQNDYDEHVFTLIDGADVTMLQGAGYVQEGQTP